MTRTRTIVTASIAGLLLAGVALAPRHTAAPSPTVVDVAPAAAVPAPAAEPPPSPTVDIAVPPLVEPPDPAPAVVPEPAVVAPQTTPPAQPAVEPPPVSPVDPGYCSRAGKVKATCIPANQPVTVTSTGSSEPVFLVDATGGYCYATGASEAAAAGEPDGSPRCAGSTSSHPVTPTPN